jgi:phospholipid/cholesterol/gamma-HCH transport system substrate-binding protein
VVTKIPAVALAALLLVGGGLVWKAADRDYIVQVPLPSAAKVVEGAPVLVDGFEAGSVESLEVKDSQALVTLRLDSDYAPLHEGAEVAISWRAALSERNISVTDGPAEAPEIDAGGTIPGPMPKGVELDEVLAALDEPTRQHLQGLVKKLSATVEGREGQVNRTISATGPTLDALGQVLRAVGSDGPAIRNLVSRLNQLVGRLAARDGDVRQITASLATITERVAEHRSELGETLQELPTTLRQADKTLGHVPDVVSAAVPLLEDLEPATAKLQPVAADLSPLLRDLRPLIADLRPTLAVAERVLGITPGLLDASHDVLPGAAGVIDDVQVPVENVRPYTPEMVGMLTTWASAFSNYDSEGYFSRIFAQAGTTSPLVNPGVVPPGITIDSYPDPGAVVGQPWTDATGSGMR